MAAKGTPLPRAPAPSLARSDPCTSVNVADMSSHRSTALMQRLQATAIQQVTRPKPRAS